jgi:hypothetical protein
VGIKEKEAVLLLLSVYCMHMFYHALCNWIYCNHCQYC